LDFTSLINKPTLCVFYFDLNDGRVYETASV